MKRLLILCVDRPRTVTGIMAVVTLLMALVALLPSVWPDSFPYLHPLKLDTDPENMLPADEPVRLFHDSMKKELALYDIIVVGVVNEKHPDGVFNPDTLKNIHALVEYAKTLTWPSEDDPGMRVGVVEADILAPSTVDNIEQGGRGRVRFEWLMSEPPKTRKEALAVRDKALRLPFLKGSLVSENGKALALYIPITSKRLSYKVSGKLKEKIDSFQGDATYFITGLPVAEDTFGVEMFEQMAISAPMAMLVIFLLLLYFFRKPVLIISPLIVAMVSVICAMGLLIATGNTVHIMSSLIPIFIMPIAVLDAIHILSDFFDRYQETRDRRKTILEVMETLSTPMLFTTLTTAVGFSSLAIAPIPPVQVFGLFVAFGVFVAWFFTVTFIPAYIMLIDPACLVDFGMARSGHGQDDSGPLIARLLVWIGRFTHSRARVVMAATLVLSVVAVYGMTLIKINDNPVKWFKTDHPIRVADTVLNENFGGTYMAYLALKAPDTEWDPQRYTASLIDALAGSLTDAGGVFDMAVAEIKKTGPAASSKKELLDRLDSWAGDKAFEAEDGRAEAWDRLLFIIDTERQRDQLFKRPDVLNYMSRLQGFLLSTGVVGKSNSLADIVMTVRRELFMGKDEEYRVPDTSNGVAQTLITYQSSHRPRDLWHFVTPDFKKASIWVQLKSGDNIDMSGVARAVDEFIAANPPPVPITHQWFGLTYINVIWQDKMVSGMSRSFMGSFLVVLLMMIILFRSSAWGLLSMIPLTFTIGLIYGIIGLVGKDYDMPVAVLSSLSLGLAVDYAIHFLARTRALQLEYGSWPATVGPVFGEPARAIARNVVVVGIGFLPLLAAPLIPYRTVGLLIAAILLTAGVASLLILPAMITLAGKWLFPRTDSIRFTCKCGTCIVTAVTIIALAVVNVRQFLFIGWTTLTWVSIAAILVMVWICNRAANPVPPCPRNR